MKKKNIYSILYKKNTIIIIIFIKDLWAFMDQPHVVKVFLIDTKKSHYIFIKTEVLFSHNSKYNILKLYQDPQ